MHWSRTGHWRVGVLTSSSVTKRPQGFHCHSCSMALFLSSPLVKIKEIFEMDDLNNAANTASLLMNLAQFCHIRSKDLKMGGNSG